MPRFYFPKGQRVTNHSNDETQVDSALDNMYTLQTTQPRKPRVSTYRNPKAKHGKKKPNTWWHSKFKTNDCGIIIKLRPFKKRSEYKTDEPIQYVHLGYYQISKKFIDMRRKSSKECITVNPKHTSIKKDDRSPFKKELTIVTSPSMYYSTFVNSLFSSVSLSLFSCNNSCSSVCYIVPDMQR